MADQLGMSVSGYGKIERSDSDINLSKITKIAEILNVSRALLLEFNSEQILSAIDGKSMLEESKAFNNKPSEKALSEDKQEDLTTLLDIIRSLKEENKRLKSKLKQYEPNNEWL